VVADLEDVHRRYPATRHQCVLDRRLGVPSEQCSKPAEPEDEDDRSIVDVTVGNGRGEVGRCRVGDLEPRSAAEVEAHASLGDVDRDSVP
jgi:hypothetical protein